MKTQIITLESHDDLISVRDRMSWAKSKRILLVWPGFERVSLRPVDLRILQQHARYLGAELGLVTRQGSIRREAQGFGIPVFRSAAEAQRRSWPSAGGQPPERRVAAADGAKLRSMRDEARLKPGRLGSSAIVRIGSFAVGVLAVLTLAALFVPRATIKLTPVSNEQSLTLPIKADPASNEVAISGSVPARELSVTVSGTQSLKVSSEASVPQNKAVGVAEFKNLTQAQVTIPAGTIVYSSTPVAARFATENEVRLSGSLNASAQVPIAAVRGGTQGNLPANAIQAVEGAIGTSVSVTNPDPTVGGTNQTTIVPSADDRERVRQALVAALESQAAEQMQGMIGPQDILLRNTLQAGKVQDETYDPAAGDPGAQVTAKMTMDFQAQYVKAEDVGSLATGALAASAPAGYVPATGSVTFSLEGTPTADASGVSRFDLLVKCKMVRVLDLARVVALVRGQPPAVAAAMLQAQFPLQAPPEVTISPSWWPWLPLIPFRITVTGA